MGYKSVIVKEMEAKSRKRSPYFNNTKINNERVLGLFLKAMVPPVDRSRANALKGHSLIRSKSVCNAYNEIIDKEAIVKKKWEMKTNVGGTEVEIVKKSLIRNHGSGWWPLFPPFMKS